MFSQEFLTNFLLFWAVTYAIGILLGRYMGKERFRVGVFYLEISPSPRKFMGVLRSLSKIVGPLFKVSIASLLVLSVLASIYIVKITVDTLFGPKVAQIVPIIPGVTLDLSIPVLLSIFIVLVVHEFGHAAASVYSGVPVKKISFFILFLLIGAFVEPDEETIKRLNPIRRMGIYSSGIFMNLLTALLVFLIALSMFPGFFRSSSGVYVEHVFRDGPSYGIIPDGVVIKQIGNYRVKDLPSLMDALRKYKPGDEVPIVTDRGTFLVKLGSRPDNPELPFLGVRLSPFPYYDSVLPLPTSISIALVELFTYLLIFNVGLAGLNALPMLPLDGGLVLSELLTIYLGDEVLAKKLSWAVSAPLILMLIYNILLFFLS